MEANFIIHHRCTAVSSEMLKTHGVKSSAVFIFAGQQIELTLKPNSEV